MSTWRAALPFSHQQRLCLMGFDRVSQDSRRTENKKARNHAGFVLDITDCRAMPEAGLLPLNRRRWLTGNVIDHAGNAVHFVNDTIGHAAQEIIRQVRPVGSHEVDGFDRTQ